jgi:hypothetical protein
MEHEDEWKLPEEFPMPAELSKVEEKSFPYKIKSGPNKGDDAVFVKWEWEFKIIDGEYAGLRAWGETEPKLTNHPDNKVRQWAETLRGAEFDMGEGLDTDDLIGLPCVITVAHLKEEKKNAPGEFYYKTPVADVFPADSLGNDEPPF